MSKDRFNELRRIGGTRFAATMACAVGVAMATVQLWIRSL